MQLRVSVIGLALGLAAALPTFANADEPQAAPAPEWYDRVKVSGFIDLYYSYNFNRPQSRTNSFGPGLASNFDFEHNAVSLSMAELVIQKAADPAGFRLDLDFGPTTDFIHCGVTNCGAVTPESAEAPFRWVQQAYVTYATPFGPSIEFGKFVTHMGAEAIESKDNWNYTRGLLFAYAVPYYHAGARVNLPLADWAYVNGYLYNGWNNVVENNGIKTYGAQVAITPVKQLPIILNWIGPEESLGVFSDKQVFDAIIGFNPTDALSFLLNYDFGMLEDTADDSKHYAGIAGYARWKVKACALALRYEYLDDQDGIAVGVPKNTLQEATVTVEHTYGGSLLTRLEFRHEMADEKIFETNDGPGAKDRANRVVLGVVYPF
jgi:hypothetical protein